MGSVGWSKRRARLAFSFHAALSSSPALDGALMWSLTCKPFPKGSSLRFNATETLAKVLKDWTYYNTA